jgi:hypothetical protein
MKDSEAIAPRNSAGQLAVHRALLRAIETGKTISTLTGGPS